MKIFLISLSVVSSILLIIVILLQQGKGADLGSAFGSGARGGLFTNSGKANFLTRITSGLVTVFLLSALALSIFLSESQQDGVFQELQGDDSLLSQEIEEEGEVILGSDAEGDDAPEGAEDAEELVIENDTKSEQTPD